MQCVQCQDADCSLCSSFQTCEKCKEGYGFNSKGVCSKCSVDNCGTCDSSLNKCIECSQGFYLTEDMKCGKCEAENCGQCNQELPCCLTCQKGYAFDFNQVSSNFGKCVPFDIPNCEEADDRNISRCLTCIYDYYVDENGECVLHNEVSDAVDRNDKKGKLSSGSIAGIVIGCIVLVALIILLIFCFVKKRKSAYSRSESQDENSVGY